MKLNYQKATQFIKFCFIGASNTVVHFLVSVFFIELLDVNYAIASALGFLCGIMNSYFLNSRFTFQSAHTPAKFIRFVAVNGVSLSVNTIIMIVLVEKLMLHYYGAFAAATAANLILNFTLSTRFVFGSKGAEKSEA